MGIIQSPSVLPGQVGVIGAIKYMVTTDNLATITAAGYLNNLDLAVNPIAASDVLGITYSYNVNTNAGTFDLFTVSLSNGVITIVPNTSSVTLPTIANHIATYTNTSGGLSEDPATAISGGNIQAGLSGTAGTLSSFPSTAANGKFIFAAVNNTGNFNSTISNSNVAQAVVYSLPDPSAATSNIAVTGGALVSGNLVQASGTAGVIIDSGVPVANLSAIQTVSVTMNTAAVTGAYATPVQLIAAPGAGKTIMLLQTWIYTASTGNTAYASGGVATIQYGNTVHGGGTSAIAAASIAAAEITAASSQIFNNLGYASATVTTGNTNAGIFFSNQTGAFTGGTGTNIVVTLQYLVLTASV